MRACNLSHREVMPDLSGLDDWNEITLNTGTQSTLQDIKVSEKSGGFYYQNAQVQHTRNRFIYWRVYQDVLELSEISLDYNLYQSNVRYKFTDSPVITVSISEQEKSVTILVATVSSLHRISYPHPNVIADGSVQGSSSVSGSESISSGIGSNQSYSIFRDASAASMNKENSFHIIDASNNLIPHAAAAFLSPDGENAFFALACQTQLTLYKMNCANGHTDSYQLKEYNIMPRLFTNLKGAIIGKNDISDADFATSVAFVNINKQVQLACLYRNDVLRLWSTNTQQIISSINLKLNSNGEQRTRGPQNNCLRKINDRNLCAFLSHATGAEFIRIEIVSDRHNPAGGLGFVNRRVILAPNLDLADFDVSETRLWALWSNAEGEFSVSNYMLSPAANGSLQQWVSAAMEPAPDRCCVFHEEGMDPREAYCSYIFHPGKFDRNVISKALLTFRRNNSPFEAKHCSMALLKEHVCQVIEQELQNEFKDTEITEKEYTDSAGRLWERLYSACEQYHMKACQPTGLFILEPMGGVCIVKKNNISLLRPCELLEHLWLHGNLLDVATVVPTYFSNTPSKGVDMVNLIEVISQLENWLSEEIKIKLDKKLYQLETPRELLSKLANEILSNTTTFPPNFMVEIRKKLKNIGDLSASISWLLDHLRMNNETPLAMKPNLEFHQSSRFLFNIGVLFGSSIGLSLLTETVQQNARIRFAVCRNLLILQHILIETHALSVDLVEKIRTNFVPDVEILLQAYYSMVWISEMPVNLSSVASLETSIQRLNLLQLTSNSGRIYSLGSGKTQTVSFLRVFLNAKGLHTALSQYADSFDPNPAWENSLMTINTMVSQLIWPVSYDFTFGEWLLGTCQHFLIEEYVRLLNSWCEWNASSRKFILAVSLLDCGEPQKAYDYFLQSARGVLTESYLKNKILKTSPLAQRFEELHLVNDRSEEAMKLSNQATAQFYLKAIQLFEQHKALGHIISMAQAAIAILEKNDPQLPMFQSIVFKNQLSLEHYDEAYHSLIYNAEHGRRKDCLRELVNTLFGRRRQDFLMHLPLVGLHDDFENIVEMRARSYPIEENDIYDFLYAFHVNKGNMRKASSAMYEQAMRLQTDGETIDALKKRCDCLVVCINALHLIDARYRWIAKPVVNEDELRNLIHDQDTTDAMDTSQSTTDLGAEFREQMVVLEIKDISREFLHTEALVRLAQTRKDVRSFLKAGPAELSLVLVSCSLYTDAIKLAKGFDISLLPIFDGLTSACVRTADESPNEAWSWLQENDLADLPHRNNAPDMAWALLQSLVEEHEKVNSTLIRKCVANKILSLNAFLPQWLVSSYKLDNSAELLHLFVKYSRLLEAAEFAQEMIKAMLGSGNEYFNYKIPVSVTNPELCLPLATLDLLLYALKLNAADIEYKQALVELEEIIEKYISTCEYTADEKKRIAFEKEHERLQFV